MQSFHTPGPVALRLRVPAGEIEIETMDGEDTTVEVVPLRNDEATLAAVEETRIDVRGRPSGGHEVRVDVPERGSTSRLGFLFNRSPEVRVSIRCPHHAELQLKTRSADLDGRGRFGNTEVESTSGDTVIGEIDGSARVHAVSGDVRIGRVGGTSELQTVSGDILLEAGNGPAALQSVSGDLQLRDAGGSVNVNTVSGDQWVDNAGNGPVSSQSVSGDIRVGVRPGLRVWIDAASRSGDVTSELDVGDAPAAEGAVAELRIQTLSGDVAIVRSAGAGPMAPGFHFELKEHELEHYIEPELDH
jgi:DUF4097 and DUF4098 domain-containing protein YvlB